MPRISIVTPSFNQAQYIDRTIRSIISQDVNMEYIIIDACSTDGTADILRGYKSKAKIIIEKDEGQTDAIAKGFSMASGEILGWLNADDMYLPGALAKVISAFDKGNEFVYGQVHIIDSNDGILRKRVAIPVTFNDLYYGEYIISQESTFFSKKLYVECGGVDKTFHYAMDYDLWLRMSHLRQPYILHDFIACFRFHHAQKSRYVDRYCDEMKRARKRFYLSHPPSGMKSLYYKYSLALRKFMGYSRYQGFCQTSSDLLSGKYGKLR